MPSILNATTTSGLVTSADNSGSLQLQTNNGTTAVTIDTSQNVGIGETSPAGSAGYTQLVVRGSSGAELSLKGGTTQYGYVYVDNGGFRIINPQSGASSGTLQFYTSNTERMRIASDGTLQVKSSTTTAPWDATSGNYVWVGGTYPVGGANSDIIAIFNRHTNNGTVVEIKKGTSLLGTISHNGTNTAYNTSSDYRLKENVAPMQNALGVVTQLKPVTYTWKETGTNGQGFIAHELQEVMPDAVTGEKDAIDKNGKIVPQQIDTSFLVATLTAAIQEQQAQIEELKTELDATKAEVQALKGVA